MTLHIVPGIIEVPSHGVGLESFHLGVQLDGQTSANESQSE